VTPGQDGPRPNPNATPAPPSIGGLQLGTTGRISIVTDNDNTDPFLRRAGKEEFHDANQGQQQQTAIAVPVDLIRAAGEANEAVVWPTIDKACAKRGPCTVWHKNGRWYRAPLAEIAAETGLAAHQVRYSIQVLQARGPIESTWLDASQTTTRLNHTKF